eukprot:2827198-Amphidinium_carterae.1
MESWMHPLESPTSRKGLASPSARRTRSNRQPVLLPRSWRLGGFVTTPVETHPRTTYEIDPAVRSGRTLCDCVLVG